MIVHVSSTPQSSQLLGQLSATSNLTRAAAEVAARCSIDFLGPKERVRKSLALS